MIIGLDLNQQKKYIHNLEDLTMESVAIEKEAMKLSPVEKALLADRLLQSLDLEREENAKAWAKVAEQRLEEYNAGRMDAYDGQTVIHSLKNKTS